MRSQPTTCFHCGICGGNIGAEAVDSQQDNALSRASGRSRDHQEPASRSFVNLVVQRQGVRQGPCWISVPAVHWPDISESMPLRRIGSRTRRDSLEATGERSGTLNAELVSFTANAPQRLPLLSIQRWRKGRTGHIGLFVYEPPSFLAIGVYQKCHVATTNFAA